MLKTDKFVRSFTTPAKDVVAITSVAYANGEMGWKTVHYPVAGITRIVQQLLVIDTKIKDIEHSLELNGIINKNYDDQIITKNVEDITGTVLKFLIDGSDNAPRIIKGLVEAAIRLVLKKCFNLLTPVSYRGYFITDESFHRGFVDTTSTQELQLPDDILNEIYPKIGLLSTSTMFELVSKDIKGKYNKPFPYEKYTTTLPHVVLMKAIKDYNREKDPMVKKRLLYIIRSALASGAIYSMPRYYFWNLFKFRDLSTIDLVMTEIICVCSLYPARERLHPINDQLVTPLNIEEGLFAFERTDILERYIKLGVFMTVDEYRQYEFEGTSHMQYSDARFIPDNYMSFVESSGLVDVLESALGFGDDRSIYKAIKSGSFSTKFHPELLVDAINKGYITTEHPITDEVPNIYSLDIIKKMGKKVKDYHRGILSKYLPANSIYLKFSLVPESEQYSTYDQFMSTVKTAEAMNTGLPFSLKKGKEYPTLIRLENGNYITISEGHLMTLSRSPEGVFIERGLSMPKEIEEMIYKIDSLPTDTKNDIVFKTLSYIETDISHVGISRLYSIFSKCVLLTWELLYGKEATKVLNGPSLYSRIVDRPLLRVLVTSYRDNKYKVPPISL